MAKLDFFLVCDSVAVDRETNRLSIFNVLENISATGLPAVHPQSAAVILLSAEEGDYGKDFQLLLRVMRPSKEPAEFPMNFQIEEGKSRHRLIYRFAAIELLAAGMLEFEASLNGQQLGVYRVPFTVTPEAAQQH